MLIRGRPVFGLSPGSGVNQSVSLRKRRLLGAGRSWQLRWMALLARVALCMLAAACADNPYVIGHAREVRDAAADASVPNDGLDASVADCSGALVCSAFEGELRAEWPETVIEGSGEIERSTARAHSGVGSLHVSSRSMESVADVVKRFSALRSGSLYLRAYLYVPAGPTDIINLFFVGSRPDPFNGDPFVGVDLNVVDGALQLFSPQAKPTRQTGTLEIPRDRWFCLRAELAISGDATAAVFIEDAQALRATGIDSLADDGVSMLRAGIDWSSSQATLFELFMDDLVLDTKPVACLPD